MAKNNQGLTATYNRFHDRDEKDPAILELRQLHAMMDRENGKRKAKKPWRYRWPGDIRGEVLARLLALNRERAERQRSEVYFLGRRSRKTVLGSPIAASEISGERGLAELLVKCEATGRKGFPDEMVPVEVGSKRIARDRSPVRPVRRVRAGAWARRWPGPHLG